MVRAVWAGWASVGNECAMCPAPPNPVNIGLPETVKMSTIEGAPMHKRKILLIGKNGQVGWELCRTLAPLGVMAMADHPTLDLAQPDQIRSLIDDYRPILIVNAAAYTAVDQAEDDFERAMSINGTAPGIIAEEARRIGAGVIHYSTDYVFDGRKETPYTEDDEPAPLNNYGRTKLAGDEAIRAAGCPYLIFRTSWVYGNRGNNFLRTIFRLLAEREEIGIVDDQIGSPTWSRIIAEITAQALAQLTTDDGFGRMAEVSGLYNLSAHGQTSWFGFACEIARLAGERHLLPRMGRINPIPSSCYPTPAQRPHCGVLDNRRLGERFHLFPPHWETQIDLCLDPSA